MGDVWYPARAGDLAKALREQAPPREVARIIRDAEPARDPIAFRTISGPIQARLLPATGKYGGRPVFWATHSATNTQDLHGTWWSPRALESMRLTAADGLTMFLNHEYRVPEDVLGMSVEARLEERADPNAGTRHTDLDVATLVVPEDVNPRAMQTYRAIQAGVKLGQSVGVFILDWAWTDPDGNRLADVEEDFFGPLPYAGEAAEARLTIDDVLMVESSTVGIPSNRRGWVHEAARALRRAGVLPERAGERPRCAYSIPKDAPDQQRSADVEPIEDPAAAPDAARCADCGCACTAGSPDPGCTCDCAQCRGAREDAETSAAAVPGGDPAPLEPEPAADATLAQAGRTLDELDAALNAAGGIVPGGRVAALGEADAEAEAARVARKAAKKAAKLAAIAQESPASAPEPAPSAPTHVEIALAGAQLAALQAEVAAARAVRDELAAESKALRKAAKQAARAIAAADNTGLYRPTRRLAYEGEISDRDLVAMDDTRAIAALRAHVQA